MKKVKINNIKLNALLNTVYTLVNMIFPLITYPYISRVLSASGLGRVNFFTSVANYAILFASLGLGTYGIRAVAKVRDNNDELAKTTKELVVLNGIATLVVMVIYIALAAMVPRFYNNLPLVIVNGIWIATTPWGMNWLYSGLEQYSYITKRTVAFKLISLILIFFFVKTKSDYLNYAAILVFANVGAFLCNYLNAKKFIKPYAGKLSLRKHLRPTITLFASALAVSVYTNLDMIMLGFIRDDYQVGLYTIAVKAQTVLLALVNALSTVLLPRLSFYISEQRYEEFNIILKKSMSVIFIITLSLTTFFILTAQNCVYILGGKSFEKATLSMQILMPILIISGFSNITGNQILIPQGKDSSFMHAVVSGSVVAFILNLILMKPLGAIGGSIATLLAEMVQMSVQLYYARVEVLNNFQFKPIAKTLLSLIVAVIVTTVVTPFIHLNAFFVFSLQGAIFFLVELLMLFVVKEKYVVNTFEGIIGSRFK